MAEHELYDPTEAEQQALHLIAGEKIAWEQGEVLTSDVSYFKMRNEIDTARKNYYGQFEKPVDSDTGLEKIHVPMTEWTVETSVRNTDVDQKDIRITSSNGKNPNVATVLRLIVNNFLDKTNFGELLNDALRRMHIDGTVIIKAFDEWNPEFKRNMLKLSIVDPLNFIIDPSARSIQDGPVIEKTVLTIDEVDRHKDWNNKVHIAFTDSSVPTAEIYERWGKIRKSWITKDEGDSDTWVEGTITASATSHDNESGTKVQGASGNTSDTIFVIHKIEINTRGLKPYEEGWLKRVPNRWHGRGIPEQIKHLQEYINTIVNIRRDDLLNKLTGKYKVRQGSGITKQMLQSLKAGGAIVVDEMDDIQELIERDVHTSAYQEPNEILLMADRVTGANETARGEVASASQTATTTVIQDRRTAGAFADITENFGLLMERLYRRHIIPSVVRGLKESEVVRITGDLGDLQVIDNAVIDHFINQARIKAQGNNTRLTIFDERNIRKRAETKLNGMGKDRFVEISKLIFNAEFDVKVDATTNRLDPNIVVKQLQDLLFSYSNIPGVNLDVDAVMQETLDLLGLSGNRFITKGSGPQIPQTPTPQQGARPSQAQPSAASEFSRANFEGTLSPQAR